MSAVKWLPFYSGFSVLTYIQYNMAVKYCDVIMIYMYVGAQVEKMSSCLLAAGKMLAAPKLI